MFPNGADITQISYTTNLGLAPMKTEGQAQEAHDISRKQSFFTSCNKMSRN